MRGNREVAGIYSAIAANTSASSDRMHAQTISGINEVNNYAGVDYATGYAVADKITGPYTKPSREPLLASDLKNGAALGPGGQDVVVDKDGDTWLAFHSWDPSASYRRMMIEQLVWEGDTPVVQGPDRGPQPKP